ncbi:hypothetical protein [Humibacter ginsenosidimutans]|uniref:Gluconate 2-dehydrogenase subunit 3 family protein n=1 Tax=Humibacter ginsenosidimutans TaxID=2599293 RepID=A0A5B8M6R8_9MICO|nr:hypothetical protein [Humibacter ginsenosidimutans]QDZ16093.1 hypothetical protein FPZ11_16175 [Humibacter ginsenosidimutans]
MLSDSLDPHREALRRQSGFDSEDRETLMIVARSMYPHDRLSDDPYRRVVDAILDEGERDAELTDALLDGLSELRRAGLFTLGWRENDIVDHLKSIAAGPFFTAFRSRVVWHLYNDHEVWEFIGYPGESFSQGGYLHRGFDDLDWLPSPRVTENAEPMLEVVADLEQEEDASR